MPKEPVPLKSGQVVEDLENSHIISIREVLDALNQVIEAFCYRRLRATVSQPRQGEDQSRILNSTVAAIITHNL